MTMRIFVVVAVDAVQVLASPGEKPRLAESAA